MSRAKKKFLDENGLAYFASKLDDYPSNDVLGAVIDAIDNVKADVNSPQFTGVPTVPTASSSTNTNQIASTAFVQNKLIESGLTSISLPNNQSGDIVSFQSEAAGRPIRTVVNIEPVQSGNGDPSPDNVRPITGWTNINILRTGKNILDLTTFVPVWDTVAGTVSSNKIILTYKSGTGQGGPHMLLKAGDYTFQFLSVEHSSSDTEWVIAVVEYNTSNNYAWFSSAQYTSGVRHISFTLSEEKDIIILLRMRQSGTTLTTSDTMIITNPMLYRGEYDSDVSFEPYSGNNYSVSFETAGTVYGGTLDLARGLLAVDRVSINLAAREWTYAGGAFLFYTSDVLLPDAPTTAAEIMCSHYRTVSYSGASALNNIVYTSWATADAKLIAVKDSAYTDINTFKAAMSGVQLVAKLNSPLTYQLTPQQLVTLAGTNNVFAYCGPVTVTHWPGTGTPVEPVEDGAEIAYRAETLRQIEELRNAILAMGGNL